MKTEQAKLNKLAHKNKKRIAVILEGRDSAGKSGTIRQITQYLNPAWFSVCLSTMPSKHTMRNWLPHWETKMPSKGQIVFYDRSWYSRGMVQAVNGWCSQKQYANFMARVMDWEAKQEDVIFIKFWLSISIEEQILRLEDREISPLKYWKLSPNDKLAVSRYDDMTIKKETIHNSCGPWVSLDYNDKQAGRLEFIKRLNLELGK
jgi:polyphosphate kinase 2 (PPK2 family)